MGDDAVGGTFASPREIWLVVGGLLLGTFLGAMDTLVVITALPTMVGELGGRAQASWIITAYMLAVTAAAPLIGKLGDLWGRRRLYQLSVAGFIVASVLCGLAQNMNQLIVARSLQGVAGAGLGVLPMALIADIAPPRDRARYQGMMGASFTAAMFIGPVVGGFFVDHGSWRGVFFINVPFGLIALAASTTMRIPHQERVRRPIDWLGSLVLVGATLCLLLVVTLGGETYSWSSPVIVVLGAGACVLAAAFIAVERRVAEPVLPLRLFSEPNFTTLSIGALFFAMAVFGAWTLLPLFLQTVVGESATNAGLLLSPLLMASTVTSIVCGQLISRYDRSKIFPVTGMALVTVAFVLYATMGTSTGWTEVAIYEVIAGIGVGMNMQVLVIMVQGVVARRDIGVGTAAISFFRQLGGVLGSAIALSIFNAVLNDRLASTFDPGVLDAIDPDAIEGSPSAIRALDAEVRDPLIGSFADALQMAFVALVPIAVVGFVVMTFLREIRMGESESEAVAVGPDPNPSAGPHGS